MDRLASRSLIEIEAEITELTRHLNAAHYRWLALIAGFDRRNGWVDSGCVSCAHWLNVKCGVALGAAREKVRVARALEQLPKLAAEMARGAVSYSTTPLDDWAQLPRRHCAEGVHIDRSTAVTRWRGEQMDYGIAIDALLARSRNVAEEAH